MEFHEKLQKLRKQKGLTQEDLAARLFVSRAAISKWESGRGYPNIDSLKAIAAFFSVTIDELLSGAEVMTIAQEESRQKEAHSRALVFGLLDLSGVMYFFLPLFAQRTGGAVQAVSLLALNETNSYRRIAFFAAVIGIILWGILTLALQNCSQAFWVRSRHKISLLFATAGTLLFVFCLQPYAAAFLFLFLIIKVFMLNKGR